MLIHDYNKMPPLYEFFGGINAFKYRKKLDVLKEIKCKTNNVILIEWNYKDNVSKSNSQRILKPYITII